MRNFFGSITSAFSSTPNDLSQLETLCVMLGPYRNLTTLTSSLLALHPHCQVLNHAGERVFGNEKINFLQNYSSQKFDAFCDFAVSASKEGRRGRFGGSIVLSHAFDAPELNKAYQKRFGDQLVKPVIRCLVWKESQRVTNLLLKDPAGLEKLLNENKKIKFLLPVRHPLDCAESNFKTKKAQLLVNDTVLDKSTFISILFKEYEWFMTWREIFKDRFFYFTESGLTPEKIKELSAFLNLGQDNEWEKTILPLFKINKSYTHTIEELEAAIDLAELNFSEFPEFKEDMIKLLKG